MVGGALTVTVKEYVIIPTLPLKVSVRHEYLPFTTDWGWGLGLSMPKWYTKFEVKTKKI